MMKNNLIAQIVYRSIYIALAIFGLLVSIGFWSIGGSGVNGKPNFFFFTDFFDWTIVMSLIVTIPALCENIAALRQGKTHEFSKKLPLMKFCTMSSMLFGFVLGAFFVNRIGEYWLVPQTPAPGIATNYDSIFPGIATAGYWLDLAAFLPRFVLPLGYMVMWLLFEERMKSRSIYGTIGILPPTIFYFFDLFFGMIASAIYGGETGLREMGIYGVAYPFFFQDSGLSSTYHGWWWILIWPTIFGISLMILNNIVFRLSRINRGEDGKLHIDTKAKPSEDELCDIIHKIKMHFAAKKAKKQTADDNEDKK